MESDSIQDLRSVNRKNPRRISKDDFAALRASVKRWGDLSGVIKNLRTGDLVGGHQRTNLFKTVPDARIEITERLEAPNSVGTVARGYVVIGDEKFTYREVDWDEGNQKAANIAANRVQGEFALDVLAEINHELSLLDNGDELLALTGQSEKELERLNKSIGIGEDEQQEPQPGEPETLSFSITAEQREIIEEALGHIKANREMPSEQNPSMNGNALYYMSRDYLDRLHGLIDQPTNNQEPTA